ncbi:hypothetical protein H0H93_007339, partial [Arthromyces matolae]
MTVISAGFVDAAYDAQQFKDALGADTSKSLGAIRQLHAAAVLCNGASWDGAT